MARARTRTNALKRLSPQVRERAIKAALKEGFGPDEISSGELLTSFDCQGRIIGVRRNYSPI